MSTNEISGWSNRVKTEGLLFLLGEKLGSGIDRQVYVYAGNNRYVVKVELTASERFQNVREFQTWQALRWAEGDFAKLRRWLAPIIRISDCGTFMLQERTWPVLQRDMPKRIPRWLTDSKLENWGRLPDGRVVCHDYGTNLATDQGLTHHLRKVEWPKNYEEPVDG